MWQLHGTDRSYETNVYILPADGIGAAAKKWTSARPTGSSQIRLHHASRFAKEVAGGLDLALFATDSAAGVSRASRLIFLQRSRRRANARRAHAV
jgi:hypothetical protein